MNKVKEMIDFLSHGIWHVNHKDVGSVRYFFYGVLKKILLAIEMFTTKRLMAQASALTYSTLLAVVPILAVVFAVARGFGYNKYIEQWFMDSLSSQPQAAEIIVGFVNSYLVHTKSGVIFGIGLLFMIWTVVMLTSNIERSFNDIWQVTRQRSIYRTFADYLAMFIVIPVFIVLTSSTSIFIATVAKDIEDYFLIGSIMRTVISLIPYVITSLSFILLYVFMPNCKVRLVNAIVPGILAGVAMQLLQFAYINSQMWMSGYNAIYGSFAALPLFMLWLQISWTICLFGAELCYANQNLEEFAFRARTEDLSLRLRMLLAVQIMSLVCHRFEEGRPPLTALQIKLETDIPIRITQDLLNSLVSARLLSVVSGDSKGEETAYQPAESTSNMSVGMLIDRMESYGHTIFDVHTEQLSSDKWQQILKHRHDYLEAQRSLLLKDLLA